MHNNLQHCNMDLMVEELSQFEDITVLIVGAHECSYFIHKFSNKNIYSYLLTNKELGLGDYTELVDSVKKLEKLGNKLVIIFTCVAEMINLGADIEFEISKTTSILNGSDFKEHPNVIQYLYEQLLKNEDRKIQERESVLRNEYCRFVDLCNDFFCNQISYEDIKYKNILDKASTKYGVKVKHVTD